MLSGHGTASNTTTTHLMAIHDGVVPELFAIAAGTRKVDAYIADIFSGEESQLCDRGCTETAEKDISRNSTDDPGNRSKRHGEWNPLR